MTAIEAIDNELARLHEELSNETVQDNWYSEVLEEISRVNKLLGELALEQVRNPMAKILGG